MLKNSHRMSVPHISTYENLQRKPNITVFAKQTSRSGTMSRKQNFYLSDEDEKEFEARFVEAVSTLKRDVSKSELIVKHMRKAYKIPIIEVMQ